MAIALNPRRRRASAGAAWLLAVGALAGGGLSATDAPQPTPALQKFVFMTSWLAQAEHGGYYQALATGLYAKAGLDVTIAMGGPQVNTLQLLAAGKADCVMGASDLQMVQARASGVPLVIVAAMFQKDPVVLIAHDDVTSFADLKSRTLLLGTSAHQGFWPWLKLEYGLQDAQVRPYTFNVQPFVADHNLVQQGYLTSEPYAIQQAGVKATTLLLSDYGYPAYAQTVTCMERTVRERHAAVAAFVRASAEGWKSYLANQAPGNALIRRDNPAITDDQLAYTVAKLKEAGLVTSGDAARLGIGIITAARIKASLAFLVKAGLVDPTRNDLAKAYTTEFVGDLKVLP